LRLDKKLFRLCNLVGHHQEHFIATKNPRIDAYVAKSADFAKPILKHLRKVVHAGCPEVEETIKWSMPHFDYKGVMCGMAAFKEHCAFGFWKADLIFDGDKQAEKSGMGSFGCIKSLKDLPDEKTLIGYVKKAAALNQAGIKAPGRTQPKKREALPVPEYLASALKKNAKARKTFESFSPSHRREYIEWITEAKRDETRKERLAKTIKWLSEGKPRNWKYMRQRSSRVASRRHRSSR
jgi:uncharacterized protein YdeI (YjbR/CyaY-like superfamily)